MNKLKRFEDFDWVDAVTEIQDEDDVQMDSQIEDPSYEDELSNKLYNLLKSAKNKLDKSKIVQIVNDIKNKL